MPKDGWLCVSLNTAVARAPDVLSEVTSRPGAQWDSIVVLETSNTPSVLGSCPAGCPERRLARHSWSDSTPAGANLRRARQSGSALRKRGKHRRRKDCNVIAPHRMPYRFRRSSILRKQIRRYARSSSSSSFACASARDLLMRSIC